MRHAEWMEHDERLDDVPPYLKAKWRAVPSIAALMPVYAGHAKVDYCIAADMGAEQNPILIANNLPQDVADHIVALHNAWVPIRPTPPS